jgi:hypothetical protein
MIKSLKDATSPLVIRSIYFAYFHTHSKYGLIGVQVVCAVYRTVRFHKQPLVLRESCTVPRPFVHME